MVTNFIRWMIGIVIYWWTCRIDICTCIKRNYKKKIISKEIWKWIYRVWFVACAVRWCVVGDVSSSSCVIKFNVVFIVDNDVDSVVVGCSSSSDM